MVVLTRKHGPFRVADKVRVHYIFTNPVEGVVVEEEDHTGFIEVEEDYAGGKNRFVALPDRCERI